MRDTSVEKVVLAALCQLGADIYYQINDLISEEVFSIDSNRLIFKCLKHLFDGGITKVDWTALLSSAHDLGFAEILSDEREKQYMQYMFEFPFHEENIQTYAKKLYKLYLIRLAKQKNALTTEQLEELNGSENVTSLISILEKPALEIVDVIAGYENNEIIRLGSNIDDYVQHLIDNPVDIVGISSGFPIYDYSIGGGFRRKTISMIAARPKTGKTYLADTFGVNISSRGTPVLNLDTEMSEEDHYNRILAMLSRVSINKIETGSFARNKAEYLKVMEAKERFKSIPYYYQSIAGKPLEETFSLVKRWLKTEVGYDENGQVKDCLIIYDYLKLMSSADINGNMAEYQVLGFLISNMHNFANRYNVPILGFVQLNRDGIDGEDTDSVSQSDRINWLCSNLTFFKRKTAEEMKEDGMQNGNRKLIPIMSRHGQDWNHGDYINVIMNGAIGSLVEHKTNSQLKKQAKSDKDFDVGDTNVDF